MSAARSFAHRLSWRLGLQDVVFRLRQRRLALAAAPAPASDLPLPPPLLRVKVVGYADPHAFLQSGEATVAEFDAVLRRSGPGLSDGGEVLDLGCGCGRLARWIPQAEGRLTGLDIEPRAIAWCAANLPGGFHVNVLGDRLPCREASFDLVYACSVVTHLRKATAAACLQEIARVLKPGGRALVTFHDLAHPSVGAPPPELLEHGYAVRFDSLEGSSLLAAFVTAERLAALAAPQLELVEAIPSGQTVCGQAIAVLRRT